MPPVWQQAWPRSVSRKAGQSAAARSQRSKNTQEGRPWAFLEGVLVKIEGVLVKNKNVRRFNISMHANITNVFDYVEIR